MLRKLYVKAQDAIILEILKHIMYESFAHRMSEIDIEDIKCH